MRVWPPKPLAGWGGRGLPVQEGGHTPSSTFTEHTLLLSRGENRWGMVHLIEIPVHNQQTPPNERLSSRTLLLGAHPLWQGIGGGHMPTTGAQRHTGEQNVANITSIINCYSVEEIFQRKTTPEFSKRTRHEKKYVQKRTSMVHLTAVRARQLACSNCLAPSCALVSCKFIPTRMW